MRNDLPHNIDAERALLGAILIRPDVLSDVAATLGPLSGKVFYDHRHQLVWDRMCDLVQRKIPLDPVTMVSDLQNASLLHEVGGAAYIAELGGAAHTSANAEYYGRIVRDAAVMRNVMEGCRILSAKAGTAQDAAEIVDKLQTFASNIAGMRFEGHEIVSAETALAGTVSRVEMIASDEGDGTLETGVAALDEIVFGLKRGELTIVAGRPSVGKTAFGLSIAKHCAGEPNQAALYFSLEMGHQQLYMRILSAHAGMSIEEVARKRSTAGHRAVSAAKKAAEELAGLRLDVDDSGKINMYEVRSKVKRWMASLPDGVRPVVVVDYLQIMDIPGEPRSRQQDLGKITRAMKMMVRELDIPMVVLSQLSRQFDHEKSAAKGMAYLRESGDIEQDADMIVCLRLIGDDEWQKAGLPKPREDVAYIDCAVCKNRNGAIGSMTLSYDKKTQSYSRVYRENKEPEKCRMPYKEDLPDWEDSEDDMF